LKGDEQRVPEIATVVDGLRHELKVTTNAITASNQYYNNFNKSRVTFFEKREAERAHISGDVVVYHRKLQILEHEKWRLQNKKQGLNDQVQEQKEYYDAALQQARELDVLALTPKYGSTPKEIEILRKLVQLHKEKKAMVQEERCKLQLERLFYKEWYY